MSGRVKTSQIALPLLLALAAMATLYVLNRPPAGRAHQGTIDELLARMTPEQKVGQLVMAGFPGYEVSAEVSTLVGKYLLGGVMLTARNIRSPEQTADLTARLQALAAKNGAAIPLLVAADQEGGYVVRLRGRNRFPGNMALGAASSPELTRRVAFSIGQELRSVGINMNFAPVVDVNSNPANPVIGVRSFGENPKAVAEHADAFIRGLHEAGVLSTAKHFPGHGDTSQDSHIALPSVNHPRSRLEQVELYPFKRAVASGTDAIMTAHVTFPAIEPTPGLPATLSAKVLTGLLRQELGFQGLIFTDAMEMKAITDNFGLREAAVRAVIAGADIVLVGWPADWRQALVAVDALLEAVNNGTITESRVDESVRRVLAAKQRLGLFDAAPRARLLSRTEREAIEAISKQAAEQSITLVRDQRGRLPLGPKDGKVLVVVPAIGAVTGAEDSNAPGVALAKALRQHLPVVDEASIPSQPSAADRSRIVAQAARYDTVVMGTYYAWSNAYAGQAALVQELMDANREPVVIALREPYDLGRFAAVGTYLATYSANTESLEAVAAVLVGKREAPGRLPVTLPGLHPMGSRAKR